MSPIMHSHVWLILNGLRFVVIRLLKASIMTKDKEELIGRSNMNFNPKDKVGGSTTNKEKSFNKRANNFLGCPKGAGQREIGEVRRGLGSGRQRGSLQDHKRRDARVCGNPALVGN